MEKQRKLFANGNELAAWAARQIGYDVMGYYPITPSTQIAELLDQWRAEGKVAIDLIAAEGEHSAAGICYGASAGGARVFGATSANGLLYALEQFPVQSGTRMPMVMNVACRTVSGPLCIKGDQSDIMYLLNAGWLIFFAPRPQAVYDLNLIALKLAEEAGLPAAVAYDGFFTSHQKRKCEIFAEEAVVRSFLGPKRQERTALDLERPVTIGSYMGEQDVMHNKWELHGAMTMAAGRLPALLSEYEALSGRILKRVEEVQTQGADTILILLGAAFDTAKEAVEQLRNEGKAVGALTLQVLRPFPDEALWQVCARAKTVIVGDRQDSYGAGGGNLSLEVRAALQRHGFTGRVLARVYGLGGTDFYREDAVALLSLGEDATAPDFGYLGYEANVARGEERRQTLSAPAADSGEQNALIPEETRPHLTATVHDMEAGCLRVQGGSVKETTAMPKRLAPGHGACPGCGIPVNLNLLLRGIEGPVVFLVQTGCGMVTTMAYPKTAFRVPCIHNLFQNGAATMDGLIAACRQRQRRGEIPEGEITFVMVSGDGGMDIGLGSALGAACRNVPMLLFEYDNGGYMNTGYQLSYSTPYGAKSATSNVGKDSFGKKFFHRDTPLIMAASGIPYVATVAESDPADFIKKAAKAATYAKTQGMAYVKALSACPLNWNDSPAKEREVIAAAVDCCFFPLLEVEQGRLRLSYDPQERGKKVPVTEWLSRMGRTRHLMKEEYRAQVETLQAEVDRRFARLKALSGL